MGVYTLHTLAREGRGSGDDHKKKISTPNLEVLGLWTREMEDFMFVSLAEQYINVDLLSVLYVDTLYVRYALPPKGKYEMRGREYADDLVNAVQRSAAFVQLASYDTGDKIPADVALQCVYVRVDAIKAVTTVRPFITLVFSDGVTVRATGSVYNTRTITDAVELHNKPLAIEPHDVP